MKLREKTLLLIGIIVACSIIIMYVASNAVLLDGFGTLEKQNIIQNVELVTNALSNEFSSLNETIYDWAVWDDTYKFIQDHNYEYIQSNLVNSTFTTLKLNLIVYTDNSGDIVYGKEFDLQKKKQKPISESIKKYISKDSILLNSKNNNGINGVILLPEGPMMIDAHPILTSNGNGPSKGTLIFGRYLNDVEIQHISNLTQLSITVFNFNDPNVPSDFQKARQSISEESPIIVNPLNDNHIAGYTIINDIYGKPALILRIDKSRDFYNEYQNSSSYLILLFLIMGCILAIATLIYLDRVVLFRLSRFSRDITNIGKKGNLSARIFMNGEDELSSLAKSINGMLSKIKTSQDKFKESELKFRSLIQLAKDGIVLTDNEGKIILWNLGSQKMFGYTEEEILGKPISLLFPDKYWISHQRTVDNSYNSIDSGSMGETYELYGFKKDRSQFMLEISHTSWKIKDEKFYCAIIRDITDRKRTENEIKESLKEKEALLREIHHRVKNNMQIISSLLSLQGRYINDKEASNIFKESQNRVKSMAMIHEKLYQSEGLAKIDFAEYIKNLVNELFHSYWVNSNHIKLNVNADKIFLNTDTAVPCGLIINELVTNSLKYAFPVNQDSINESFTNDSKIYIELHEKNGKIILTIGDNGIGLPKSIDFENTKTLGLRLVKSLVDQLNGTMKFYNDEGVEFRVIFTQIKPKNHI